MCEDRVHRTFTNNIGHRTFAKCNTHIDNKIQTCDRCYYQLSVKESTGCARKSQRNMASPTEMTPSWSGVKLTWWIG